MRQPRRQHGVFLIEALIAILIFALGILGMISMGTAAISGQSDAQMRTEAVNYAGEIAAKIALNVDRTLGVEASLATFEHLPNAEFCTFTGAASTHPMVLEWIGRLTGTGGLPGATATSESIQVTPSPTGNKKVTVTVCWKPPTNAADAPWHRQTFVSYIN